MKTLDRLLGIDIQYHYENVHLCRTGDNIIECVCKTCGPKCSPACEHRGERGCDRRIVTYCPHKRPYEES